MDYYETIVYAMFRMDKNMGAKKQVIIRMLETVLDPELGIDVWSLGLIYNIEVIDERNVSLTITFTTPLCPQGPYIMHEIKKAVQEIGYEKVDIEVTFDPPWKPPEILRDML